LGTSWVFWWRLGGPGDFLRTCWAFLGVSWALLDVLDVSWTAMCGRIRHDVDRNPRNVKTLKNRVKTMIFGCRGFSVGLLAVFWAFLLALWRTFEDVLGIRVGVLEALEAPRRPKMVARRAKMDSNWQGERSERASEASGAIRMNSDV